MRTSIEQEQKVQPQAQEEHMNKTSSVKTVSSHRRQTIAKNSPVSKNLKRLQPRAVAKIAPGLNSSHQKPNYSPRKSVNFQQLVSKWEHLSTNNLTPAVVKKPKLRDFVDSQSGEMLENLTRKTRPGV